MDGFFDRLFPQPQYLSGLLGDEQSMLAQRQAQQQGLLGLAAGLLSAGGQSRQPINIGQAIALGLSQGQQAYGSALQQQVQGQTLAMQADERRKARQREELVRQIMPTVITPGQTTVEGMAFPVTRDEEGNLLPGVGTGAPSLNQQAIGVLRSALPPKDFNEVMKAIETEFGIVSPKTKFQEVGGALYDVTSGTPRMVVSPRPQYKEAGGALYDVSGMTPKMVVGQQVRPAGEVLEAMQVLGIQVPVEQLNEDQRKMIQGYIDRKEERKAPKVSVDLSDPTAVARAQSSVVGDWRGVLKDTGAQEVSDRYLSAVRAVQQGNAGNKAADGALIYAVGKIYDPSGAVQEGDKATILGNRSIPDRIKAAAQNVFNGGSLLPSEREQLLAVVTEQVQSRARSIDEQMVPYTQISRSLGGDGSLLRNPFRDAITNAQSMIQQPTQAAPNYRDAALEELKRRGQRK